MPSRKKARGRQNRAKKEATRTVEHRTLWEPMVLRGNPGFVAVPCEHTLVVPPQIPQEGPAVSFLDALAGEGVLTGRKEAHDPMRFCVRSVFCFPRVWKEDNERSLAIDLLLRFVRNSFVRDARIEGESWFHQSPLNEATICCMIYLLELIGTYSDLDVAVRRSTKTGAKLAGGNRRDVVKFVAKRLHCTCLKELHRAARTKVAKVGKCTGCHIQFPRSELRVCTGCRHSHYCSKACQRADRSKHECICNHPEVMRRDLPADHIFKSSM